MKELARIYTNIEIPLYEIR